MATIFTKIINGEIPSYKIAEDDEFYAFLDINPLVKGHTLVVPKEETDDLFDLHENVLARMMVFSQKVAHAIKKAYPCEKVAMMVLGLEVRHAHIHLGPMNKESDMNFAKPKLKFSEEEFQETAQKIRAYL